MKSFYLLFAVLILLFSTAACGNTNVPDNSINNPDSKIEPKPTKSEPQESGTEPEAMAIYTKQCMSCHAVDLSGLAGKNSNIQKVGARLTKEQIVSTIKNGGNIMPAQKHLTDAEVEILAAWLAEKK